MDSVISSTVASTGTSNAILSHGNSTDSSGVRSLFAFLEKQTLYDLGNREQSDQPNIHKSGQGLC